MIRALLLLAIALPASAQQAPAEPAKTPERKQLNLRLDNPSSFATIAPREKEEAKGLPSLGGDARKIDSSISAGSRADPIPKDTAPTGK